MNHRLRVEADRFDPRVVTERGERTEVEADRIGGFLFAETRWVVSLAYPVPECGEAGANAPRPGTFSHQVRCGGEALVPVHFVE
jgi:hypothetical protein